MTTISLFTPYTQLHIAIRRMTAKRGRGSTRMSRAIYRISLRYTNLLANCWGYLGYINPRYREENLSYPSHHQQSKQASNNPVFQTKNFNHLIIFKMQLTVISILTTLAATAIAVPVPGDYHPSTAKVNFFGAADASFSQYFKTDGTETDIRTSSSILYSN